MNELADHALKTAMGEADRADELWQSSKKMIALVQQETENLRQAIAEFRERTQRIAAAIEQREREIANREKFVLAREDRCTTRERELEN